MQYRQLGRTGLIVSELCFGTMTFGGRDFWTVIGAQPQEQANDLVARVMDAGINFFDTANVYSNGVSEEILGKALGNRRKDVVVATKVRGRMGPGANDVGLSRGHIMHELEASLKRLETDYIDLYQIHGFDELTPMEETLEALNDAVRMGKVRYIGCSNLAAWQMAKALGSSEKNGWARFETLQAYYTIAGRDLERELVPLMLDQKVGLLIWSPLAGGFLTGKFRRDSDRPDGARRSQFDFPPIDRERAFNCVDVMEEIAKENEATIAQIALAWLLHQPVTTSVIIGAKNMDQLNDNINAVNVTLSEDQLKRLDEVSALPPEYPGWMLQFQRQGRWPEEKQLAPEDRVAGLKRSSLPPKIWNK